MSQQTKLYVGNLSFDVTEADLEELFGKYGQPSEVNLIQDRDTGRSKGFAFITFENQQEAEAALETNDTELQGRKIRVNIAEDKRRGGGSGGRRDGQSRFRGNNNFSNRDRY